LCDLYQYEHSIKSAGSPHGVWGFIGEEAVKEGICEETSICEEVSICEESSIGEEASIEETKRGRDQCTTRSSYQYRPA